MFRHFSSKLVTATHEDTRLCVGPCKPQDDTYRARGTRTRDPA
jgi:hypothetical protein